MVRIGVVLDDMRAPAWAAWLLRAIRAHDDLELTLAVISDPARGERPSFLFGLYETLDRRVFSDPPDSLELVNISDALRSVARIQLSPIAGRRDNGAQRDEDPHADKRDVDVLVCLGTAVSPEEIPLVPRYGVWSLHIGDPHRYRGEPAEFWELFFAEPVSTSVLEAVDGNAEKRRVLYRSWTATDPVSLQRTRNPIYWKSARFVLRRLEDLAAGQWSPEIAPPDDRRSTYRGAPSNAEAARYAASLAARLTRRRLRRAAFRRQWFLGLRRRRPEILPHEDPRPWQVVSPPADRYWADPFVFESDGVAHVFFEQVRYSREKGELVVSRLEQGELSPPEPILRADHHLSYPYIFRDGGDTFMIPESGEARRVELWTATDFPTGWTPIAALLEGVNAVDATLMRHGGYYWLWANQAFDGGRLDDETFLYFSDRLDTGWTPHPRNPVVSDARRARPAGRPFLHGDLMIRPAQDCSGRYGSRVVFNAVEVLTPDDYREKPVGALGPDWAPGRNLGAHTYTFDGSWEATDCKRLVSRLRR